LTSSNEEVPLSPSSAPQVALKANSKSSPPIVVTVMEPGVAGEFALRGSMWYVPKKSVTRPGVSQDVAEQMSIVCALAEARHAAASTTLVIPFMFERSS
tara:strand:+ start:307 stop:603 length:297 start_codon:yes stop_codon:yes gene_type:complete